MTEKISNVTDLDFFTIKENLIEHFKKDNSPFKDWDFAGSGLNYMLDVLAYNTHYNAVNAHVSMNETFLDSAQIRSNVVSRAKLLGYIPKSNSGSSAIVTVSFTRSGDSSATELTLPRGSTFTANFGGKSYVYTTLNEYSTTYKNGLFTFEGVVINEGKLVTDRFLKNSAVLNQRFVISNKNIDTKTMRVRVYEHTNTSDFDTYLESANFVEYNPDTKVYFLSEDYDGYYQIEFGDGNIGKKLENLNLVEIEYLNTSDFPEDGNSVSVFNFGSSNNSDFDIVIANVDKVTTEEIASGGESRESTHSIRINAPITFMTQGRAVTTRDFEGLLKKNISGLDAISVWGGQDNSTPEYGKVFIAIKPNGSLFLTNSQRFEIEDYLDTVKTLTVKPELIDPDYLYLYFDVNFKYDNNLTSLSKSELESAVKKVLEEYNQTTLGSFEKIFQYSTLLSLIVDASNAIQSAYARIYCYKILNLYSNSNTPQSLDFKFELFGDINQTNSILSSSSWGFNSQDLFLGDEPISGSNERRVYVYRNKVVNGVKKEIKVFNDVGRLDITKGTLRLEALPTTIDTTIQISVIPNSYDINTIREQLLTFDFSRSNIVGDKNITSSTPIFRKQ